MEPFRAYRIHDDGRFGRGRLETMSEEELDTGNVVVKILHAGVNYKDALTALGRAKMAQKFPLVGGTDLSGIVESSADPRFRSGDEVFLHSFGLGSHHDGGFAQYGRFPADWVFRLVSGLSLFEAAALGVAGHSVGVALELMFKNGLTPDKGAVAVSGATGAVGSYAIDILSRLGFEVVALTRKPGEADYLRALGASEVIDSRAIDSPPRPLLEQRWAGAVDSVGGGQLAWLVATAKRDGTIASVGNAQSNEFAGNVLPFILRGVRLIGVNVNNPVEMKLRLWNRMAGPWKPRHFARIARAISLDDLPQTFDDLLEGKVRGRRVVGLASA